MKLLPRLKSHLNSLVLVTASIVFMIILGGCSTVIHSGKMDNETYSYKSVQYKNINPFNSYIRDYVVFEGANLETIEKRDSHINVIAYPIDDIIENSQQSIDYFIASETKSIRLNNFEITGKSNAIIFGKSALVITYRENYPGSLDIYIGKFAAFQYGNYIFEIYVLLKGDGHDTQNAFTLLIRSLRIDN